MSRFPIRVRLTAAFALAMILVLIVAGAFVYLRVRSSLNEVIDEGLESRAAAAAAVLRRPGPPRAAPVAEGDESFTQVLAPGNRLVDSAGGGRRPALTPSELRRASTGQVLLTRKLPGTDGSARVLARPVSQGRSGSGTTTGTGTGMVIVVGQSLADRDETLSTLLKSFGIGGPIAVLLASLLGYALAAAGLRPMEAMRRRAQDVSLEPDGENLPLPEARDEVRRLAETLNDMLERLRGSFQRERQFVADASHELRTPVAVVKAELEAALRSSDCGPQAREALVAAVDECDHMAQLAEDMLVIARAAGGALPVRAEDLDARSALQSVQQRFSDRAAGHGRALAVEAEEGLALHADPLRLRQALGNLVDNALRHGEGEVTLSAHRDDGGVSLEVTDAGAGFPPSGADQAFERFTRGDLARTRGGAGLGLAIVRAIAQAHGGRAEIVPGGEARVRVWLPAGSPDAPSPAG